jgi:hypothetical protein
MKKKIIGILVCAILLLTSIGFVSAKPASEKGITSFDSEVSIVKPNGYIYIFNIPIAPLPGQAPFRAIAIFAVDVEVEVGISVNKVEFYVNNELMDTDTEAPFKWSWTQNSFPPIPIKTLKVVGYDGDTEVGSDEIRLLYLNPFGLRP